MTDAGFETVFVNAKFNTRLVLVLRPLVHLQRSVLKEVGDEEQTLLFPRHPSEVGLAPREQFPHAHRAQRLAQRPPGQQTEAGQHDDGHARLRHVVQQRVQAVRLQAPLQAPQPARGARQEDEEAVAAVGVGQLQHLDVQRLHGPDGVVARAVHARHGDRVAVPRPELHRQRLLPVEVVLPGGPEGEGADEEQQRVGADGAGGQHGRHRTARGGVHPQVHRRLRLLRLHRHGRRPVQRHQAAGKALRQRHLLVVEHPVRHTQQQVGAGFGAGRADVTAGLDPGAVPDLSLARVVADAVVDDVVVADDVLQVFLAQVKSRPILSVFVQAIPAVDVIIDVIGVVVTQWRQRSLQWGVNAATFPFQQQGVERLSLSHALWRRQGHRQGSVSAERGDDDVARATRGVVKVEARGKCAQGLF